MSELNAIARISQPQLPPAQAMPVPPPDVSAPNASQMGQHVPDKATTATAPSPAIDKLMHSELVSPDLRAYFSEQMKQGRLDNPDDRFKFELLALQSVVQDQSYRTEMVTKLVDQAMNAMRTTLQTQA